MLNDRQWLGHALLIGYQRVRLAVRWVAQLLWDAAQLLLGAMPYLLGLLAGLIVSLLIWWRASMLEGYRDGRRE